MPFDPGLAGRLTLTITEKFSHISGLSENRMMGGYGYFLNGNMCVGIHKDTLIVRVGVPVSEILIQEPHVRVMDLTGKIMKGWATIEAEAMEDDENLKRFCAYAIEFVNTLPIKEKKK